MRGALRSDNEPFAAAFWELYLHEMYRRAGYEVEIHPHVPNSSKRPDFKMTLGHSVFYLEATSVGRDPAAISQHRRLEDVHQVLADLRLENFRVWLSTHSVGSEPLATRRLRTRLTGWVQSLDPDAVSATAASAPGFRSLPVMWWKEGDWRLEFRAVPLAPTARGVPLSALAASGPGRATSVDNVSGIRRVLATKVSRYGDLDAPLVIAVQSNTEHPTEDYEFDRALYGLSPRRPSTTGTSHLIEEGFWATSAGWRNVHVPQIISIAGLFPWTVHASTPRAWTTLQSHATLPPQPAMIAPVDVAGADPSVATSEPAYTHFGLPANWPGLQRPDFGRR